MDRPTNATCGGVDEAVLDLKIAPEDLRIESTTACLGKERVVERASELVFAALAQKVGGPAR
jgi:hypothetical protein